MILTSLYPNMMIQKNGQIYNTISDVARQEFGVAPKTLQDWINRGLIAPPPKVEYGVRLISYYPPDYIEQAKDKIREYRSRQNTKKSSTNNA